MLSRGLLLSLLLAAACSGAAPGSAAGKPAKPVRIVLLHTNDVHSHLLPFRDDEGDLVGGIARRAARIAEIRRENPHVLLLDAGDSWVGTAYYNVFGGKLEFEALSRLRYDAVAVGNHDLDDGARHLLDVAAEHARFPLLSANLLATGDLRDWMRAKGYGVSGGAPAPAPGRSDPGDDGSAGPIRLAAPFRMVETAGLRIGILGLTSDALPYLVAPSGIAGVEVEDVVGSAREWVPILRERERADLVIALTHQGLGEDRALARKVPGIDVIVGGHSHTRLFRPVRVRETPRSRGGALIVQAGRNGEYLGRLDLEVTVGEPGSDGARRCEVTGHRGSLVRLVEGDPVDPEISAFLAPYADTLEARLARPVAVLAKALPAKGTRSREAAVGNLLADAVRWAGEADLAVVNGGGIRASLPAGTVTLGDVYQMVPFENEVVVFTLTGTGLRAILNRAARNVGGGGFLQVSGVRFTIRGGEARDVTVGGVPLDEERRYRVATLSFLASGGDGYVELAALTPRGTRVSAREALLRHLAGNPDLEPGVDGRIRIEGAPGRRRPATGDPER